MRLEHYVLVGGDEKARGEREPILVETVNGPSVTVSGGVLSTAPNSPHLADECAIRQRHLMGSDPRRRNCIKE